MARLRINLKAIEHNARFLMDACASQGNTVLAVTKGVLADTSIVQRLVSAGITQLGDSRLRNIQKMRDEGFQAEYHLIRAPVPREVDEVIRLADVSYNSESETIKALASGAQSQDITHKILLMVDTGDRREGLMPDDVLEVAKDVLSMKGLVLHGLGMNVGCVSGVLPTTKNMRILVDLAESIEEKLGHKIEVISGGNTLAVPMVLEGRVPKGINHYRLGAAIWLGQCSSWDDLLPGTRCDAFELSAPIIELKWKPSLPEGEIGCDAFGRIPQFEDKGPMLRAICALGRQDIYLEGLRPLNPGIDIIGASSDHLILDVTESGNDLKIGDDIQFGLNYGALLYAMQTLYIDKEYVG